MKPADEVIRVACRHCGMVMTARRQHAGRRAECARCGQVIRIEDAPAPEHPSGLPMPRPQAPPPVVSDSVSFDCRLCATRMTFALKHVGRKTKCPDCGVVNVIPAPAEPAERVVPRAMNEASYGVYTGDDQPWGVDLARAAPKVLRVACRVCQSAIDATPEQVGESIECPDCGAATVVPTPKERPKKPAASLGAGGGYAVDSRPPPDRPDLSKAWLTETLADGRRDESNEFRASERPPLPRWPLLVGVFSFVRSPGAAARWFVLSAVLTVIAGLAVFGIGQLAAAAGAGRVGAIAGTMLGACAALFSAVTMLIWFGALAAHLMAIVVESSVGNRHVHGWPGTNPTDWAGDAVCLLIALGSAGAPGGLLAAATHTYWMGWGPMAALVPVVATTGSFALFFPLMWLSQLEESSPLGLLSPGVLLSIPRVFGTWLVLWVQSAALAGANVALIAATGAAPLLLPITAAALVYSLALYARLVGRLAWTIAERG